MLKTCCFALLLTSAAAVGAQSQSACGIECAVAPAPAAPAATAAPAPKPNEIASNKSDLNRVVCEVQETIGTRLGTKKVCMTVAQWQEFQNDVKDQTRRIEILPEASH